MLCVLTLDLGKNQDSKVAVTYFVAMPLPQER